MLAARKVWVIFFLKTRGCSIQPIVHSIARLYLALRMYGSSPTTAQQYETNAPH